MVKNGNREYRAPFLGKSFHSLISSVNKLYRWLTISVIIWYSKHISVTSHAIYYEIILSFQMSFESRHKKGAVWYGNYMQHWNNLGKSLIRCQQTKTYQTSPSQTRDGLYMVSTSGTINENTLCNRLALFEIIPWLTCTYWWLAAKLWHGHN